MKFHLETERLILREFTEDDASLLLELDNDPAVMQFITDGVPTEPDDIRNRVIPRLLECHAKSPEFGYWAAIRKDADRFVGWFHFRPGENPDDGIELGYRLMRASWGQGLATEGSQAIIERGFRKLGVDRIYACTMAANAASRRVMEKLGMRFVETFVETRFPGTDQSAVRYELTRSDWERVSADV